MQFTQFKSILELVKTFDSEQKCIDYLTAQRWDGNIVSPFDETSKVYICKGNKYRCKNTGKYFNVRTGSIFDDTKIPLVKWFMAIYIIASHKKGISSYQLGRDIDVTQKSAWFMLHRIRFAFGNEKVKPMLDGIVEVDETFVGGKAKNMHKAKRAEKFNNGTGYVNMAPIVGMVERGGRLIMTHTKRTDGAILKPMIYNNIDRGSVVMTDGYGAYAGLTRQNYTHVIINHELGIYGVGGAHTNTIEGAFGLFKRGIIGIYHFVSAKHLQQYADEFVYRYNTRRISDSERFGLLLTHVNRKLRYKELVNK